MGKEHRVEGEQLAVEVAVQTMLNAAVDLTCTECNAMVDSLRNFCKAHTVSLPLVAGFDTSCAHAVKPVSTANITQLTRKCDVFYDFVTDLFCPLDPCVQVSQSVRKAPSALCDLMKCIHTAREAAYVPVVVPLACPVYLEAIVGYCHTKPENTPLNHDMCNRYPQRFAREGCDLMLDRIFNVSLPLDFCAAAYCESIPPTEYRKYCHDVLHLSASDPMPVPAYLLWRNGSLPAVGDCVAPPEIGIVIKSATFGMGNNCSVLKNNLLAGMKARCDGRLACVFGNIDLVNQTNEWDPALEANITGCTRQFEVVYSCKLGTPDHVLSAGEEATFQAIPFDCNEELKFQTFKVQADDLFSDRIVTRPKDSPLSLL